MTRTAVLILAFVLCFPGNSHSQTSGEERVDVEAVQGVLAVRSLDGWLLTEAKEQNSIARELVIPDGPTFRRWFYFIPSFGQPSILVHKSEVSAFVNIPGKKLTYAGFRDLKTNLRTLLKGSKTIAMEYAPKSGIPSLTRVDGTTVSIVQKLGVTIQSSADLVQLTKSLWGPQGRLSHYVAVHHLNTLRGEVMALIRDKIALNQVVTEDDVQQFLARGYKMRGLSGKTSIAIGANTAKPNYASSGRFSMSIAKGQLLVLRMNAKLVSGQRPIFASMSWVAYVGSSVPVRYSQMFSVVAKARDATIDFIAERVKRRRLVMGFEADQMARREVGKAGFAARFVHRTGHSLDSSLEGDGANLDDYETHDTRRLVIGSGFTVGPGIYTGGDFGLQSTVNVHLVQGGLEVTTPVQNSIQAILAQ